MDAVRRDLLPTLRLAWPVIVAELGWMFMGVVDTLMVGRLAPEAIGAVGLGSILYFSAAIFGMGMLLGLDTFVSQSYGAGNLRECHRWLRDGIHLAVLASVPLMAITFGDSRSDAGHRPAPRCPGADRAVRHRRRLGIAAAAALRGVPPVPAGAGPGVARDDHADCRQRGQRGRQLGAHLRPPRHAGDGCGRRRLGHQPRARVHGGVAARW